MCLIKSSAGCTFSTPARYLAPEWLFEKLIEPQVFHLTPLGQKHTVDTANAPCFSPITYNRMLKMHQCHLVSYHSWCMEVSADELISPKVFLELIFFPRTRNHCTLWILSTDSFARECFPCNLGCPVCFDRLRTANIKRLSSAYTKRLAIISKHDCSTQQCRCCTWSEGPLLKFTNEWRLPNLETIESYFFL